MANSRSSMTPQEFVDKWRRSSLKERSASQEHFIDLCRMLGHPTPAQMDPEGSTFTFEKGAEKRTGGQGWADVWKKGVFGWEYKGKHRDLNAAYGQLLKYREALLNPPLLVVSDMETIVIHTNFTNTIKRVIRLSLDDLLTKEGFQMLRDVFEHPERLKAEQTSEGVTRQAAEQFGRLAESLRARGADPEKAAHFLIRILFCLFAEDVGLLPEGLLTRLVETTRSDPEVFDGQLRTLFGHMASGGFFGLDRIPHFNGGLFDDNATLLLSRDDLEILAKVALLDWSSIEPSIFGTLFERSLDPGKRAQLGAHYTSREDILLIVEPVLMRPLRRRWEEVKEEAERLTEEWRAASSAGGAKTKIRNRLQQLLHGYGDEIARTTVLDPACGSGNFLYVALKSLLDLEKEVITLSMQLGFPYSLPMSDPGQLYGIEINEYAHELAQTTVWIGYIQWLRENGFGWPSEPILKKLDNIKQMDAILAFDEDGNPIAPEWPEADVAIGNPPFLGGKRLRTELGDDYVNELFALWDGRVARESDLCCYWFEEARALIEGGRLKRSGLLATQAIRAGSSRTVVEHILATGGIFLGWSDRAWVLEGADVRVSIIGFDAGSEGFRELDGEPVDVINPDLTTFLDLTQAECLDENSDIAFMGDTKGGPFEIGADLARQMLAASWNPNGRPNSDVIRPWINARDIVTRSREKWIIDFGTTMTEAEASQYEEPFEFVRQHVKPAREKNKRAAYREKWWLHVEARPALRIAMGRLNRYIATPRVAKHRLFVFCPTATLPDSRVDAFAREDLYFFGVLHSKVHELWALAKAPRHGVGDDPTYSIAACFDTFPLPWPPGKEPVDDPRVQAIAAAAKDLVEKRDRWLNPEGASEAELKKRTLTNLYNQRPTWLDLAHRQLDDAVLDAYGWLHDISDEEILERLLALNLERAAKQRDP